MQKETNDIAIFLIVITVVLLLLTAFIVTMLYLYTKRQSFFNSTIERERLTHIQNLLATKLEIQEETFQNVSREIHDNISLSLTLCKLNLNTIDFSSQTSIILKVRNSIVLLSEAINDLRDISKSLNSDMITQLGLVKSVEQEVQRVNQTGIVKLEFILSGDPIYLDSQNDLVIFRVVQEAINNIIKHSGAEYSSVELNYMEARLQIRIYDNGKGFDFNSLNLGEQSGLKNMQARIDMLKGQMSVKSVLGSSTTLFFNIPV
jgi:two-component system, NarL family, sensor kinase